MTTKLNVDSFDTTPQQCLIALEKVKQQLNLMGVEDRKTKDMLPMKPFYRAVRFLKFPMDDSRMLIDGDGILTMEGTNAELLYHNMDSLKEMGAVMISNSLYPSPEGGDIYHDLKTWGAAQDMTRIKGRMLQIMAKAVDDTVEMVFEMEDRQPKEEHGIFGAIYVVGKLHIDVHNLCVLQKDKLREEVIALGKRHARTFEEIVRLKQDYKWTLRAVEKGFGMKPPRKSLQQ